MSDQKIDSLSDFAELLGVEPKKLSFALYKAHDSGKYSNFSIPKKSGDTRVISKPNKQIMALQRRFLQYLETKYESRPCSQGFEKERNCKTNAEKHLKRKLVLNFDIEDFFGSINFGRVFGLLKAKPFNFGKAAAAAAAKLVIHDNKLPQGAPTSPIISNMICKTFDGKLMKLCSQNASTYTRYVDDVTISTTRAAFPDSIVVAPTIATVKIGDALEHVIRSEGFKVNANKTRIQPKSIRQSVTGITVNEFKNVPRAYINQIFGMIFSWKKFGITEASKHYEKTYQCRPSKLVSESLFRAVIIGKISYVAQIRGWHDIVVLKLCTKYCECDPQPPNRIKEIGKMPAKYDVFIGHASEDKATVAKPLYDSLDALGVKAFIDIVHIAWGDSLTQKINQALGDSKIFVAVISLNSVEKSWPAKELNSAISREINKKQIILPLFVGTPEEIEIAKSKYAIMDDKVYKTWENNPDDIANSIKQRLDSLV